jgi:hypothetical protein
MTKYALIIGISYKNSEKYLAGCMNDVATIYKLLISWGFAKNNIIVLADEKVPCNDIGSINKPTSFNINSTFSNFVKQLKPSDKAVIYYSGHGMRILTSNKREESCIVPIDYKKSGVIQSESIRYYLNKVPMGVNIFCVFDCCNSGSICDLKYHIYDTSYKKDIKVKMKKYDYIDWERRQNLSVLSINDKNLQSLTLDTQANVVSLSGCWDTQYSYDLGRNGALTIALIKVIESYNIRTLQLKHLLQNVRGFTMQLRVKQTPQLMLGNKIDLNMNLWEFLN